MSGWTWVRLDDRMPDHPKVDGLSDAAFRLHVSGICYCGRHLTDGLIPGQVVKRLVPRFRPSALAELVDRGMWLPVLDGEAYEIHDFLEHNRSREQVHRHRAAQRARANRRWQEEA